jgi:hypothetical protein
LSKTWGAIEQFSEDVDLAVDRALFDLSGDLTVRQLKKLRKQSSLFVKETVCKGSCLYGIAESPCKVRHTTFLLR